MTDIQQAREWAENGAVKVNSGEVIDEIAKAAVRVIQSLPDHWIDADKVREVLDMWAGNPFPTSDEVAILNDFEALLAPSLPTLADMAPEEREACRWMQAQTWYEVGIIVWVDEMTEIAQLITRANGVLERKFKDVTPLPDLPKLEWPAQEPQPVVKTLHTVEDYENAAIGTVVRRQGIPWLAATFHKCVYGIWSSTAAHEYPSSEMAGTARTVLWEPKP
ncbi:hypothetical protein [uncultured Corynebacterium sp.]|uniref:hypothetical protein n=1 Tax=uncultured Corynebacterium sp. TaxID=159447 RepID=UPI0025F1306C|nr:hypothetical protein [uncultured Corynebacterium sp.]